MLYVIFADGTWDQVVESEQMMLREKRDLKKLGYQVKVKSYNTWKEVNEAEDRYNSRR